MLRHLTRSLFRTRTEFTLARGRSSRMGSSSLFELCHNKSSRIHMNARYCHTDLHLQGRIVWGLFCYYPISICGNPFIYWLNSMTPTFIRPCLTIISQSLRWTKWRWVYTIPSVCNVFVGCHMWQAILLLSSFCATERFVMYMQLFLIVIKQTHTPT